MTTVAVIAEGGATEADGRVDGSGAWVAVDVVQDVLGWAVKPEGLCRGDVCVPAAAALRRDADGRVDLLAIADALHRPTLVDAAGDGAAIVVGASADDRRRALQGKEMPSFSLPDLAGTVHHADEWRGTKVLLAAFASW